MAAEHVELPAHEHAFLRRCVEEGRYADANAVLVAGLRLLEQQQDEERQKLERLRAEVQKGMDDLEKGRYTTISSDEELDALFADVRRRVAESRGNKVHDVQAP